MLTCSSSGIIANKKAVCYNLDDREGVEMVDFSRAEGSKNHKNTFDKTAKTIMLYIQTLQDSYMKTWEQVEKYRKERAAIIENIIMLLKTLKIKTTKPLGRSSNDEINAELNSIIPNLDFKTREQLQCDLIKINNRFYEINRLSTELEDLMSEITAIRFPEKDNNEEVTIDLENSNSLENGSYDNADAQRIKKISLASPTLIANVQKFLAEHLADAPLSYEEPDYDNYTIHDGKTFLELTREIYQDSNLWTDLYNFSDNKEIITRRAEILNMSVENLINTPYCLDDITIKIPHELVTFVEVHLAQKKVA